MDEDGGEVIMQIRVGYRMTYDFEQPTPLIAMLSIHYSRANDIVSPDTMTYEQKTSYEHILARNHLIGRLPGPYWMLLHSPELSDNCSLVGELLRYRTDLEPRLSELAILVTARVCDSQYEWYAHHARIT